MKRIKLTQDKVALVDDEDYDRLNSSKWQAAKTGNNIYVVSYSNKNNETIYMHRLIMKARKGQMIDHKDGNGLNNQKNNLRVCDYTQNAANSRKSRINTNGYRGVYFDKLNNRWYAQIKIKGKGKHLGYFDNKDDAAECYNDIAKILHKEFARLNIITKSGGKTNGANTNTKRFERM